MKTLFDDHIDVTARVMDFQIQRQNLVSANLANMNTPGYKARHLEFEAELQAALGMNDTGPVTKTHAKHMPAPFNIDDTRATLDKVLAPRVVPGVDNVNLDKEMAIMAKNSLTYNALTTVIQKSFSGLSKVIQDGGR